MRLNLHLYNGSPVVGSDGLRYTFNSDLLPAGAVGNQQVTVAITTQPVMVLSSQPNPYATQNQYPQQAAPQMAYAEVATGNTYAQPPTAAATAVPVNDTYSKVEQNDLDKNTGAGTTAAPRQMIVVIPDGVSAGQVLTVAGPGGITVQVPVQAGHRAGQQVVVNY